MVNKTFIVIILTILVLGVIFYLVKETAVIKRKDFRIITVTKRKMKL